jgi:hypothetical protein
MMSGETEALADEVLSSFQALLDEDAKAAIGEHHFHSLHGMIREAIAEQSEAILDRLEQNLRQLKSEMVERNPLEL